MKALLLFFIFGSSLSFIGIKSSSTDIMIDRKKMIEEVVKLESEYAGANCHCRIGNDRGKSQRSYPNPIHDLGIVSTHGGFILTNSHDRACNRKCAIAASQWLNSLTDDQLCAYAKKAGVQTVLAYSKVGGRRWTVCGASKQATCCNDPGVLSCPSGTYSEHTNFPGYCSQYICDVPGDGRLYNKNGSTWGFIWQGKLAKLVKGSVSGAGWKSCN